MEKETTDDLTFKLLANPTKLKKKSNNEILNEEDELFLKIKKSIKICSYSTAIKMKY